MRCVTVNAAGDIADAYDNDLRFDLGPKPNAVESTLVERDKRYGGFINNASIAQRIKAVMHSASNWYEMSYDKREALEMIASKIGRMLSGDPEYVDNWHDIAGYATLVEQRLTKETK